MTGETIGRCIERNGKPNMPLDPVQFAITHNIKMLQRLIEYNIQDNPMLILKVQEIVSHTLDLVESLKKEV